MTAWDIAAAVPDPELPLVTLSELGILREVHENGTSVVATITPTYSGCPAMREISLDLEQRLHAAGYAEVTVKTRLAPAWSSDWITATGRQKLAAAGIVPPDQAPKGPIPLALTTSRPDVVCPRCAAPEATLTAAFSGTACKALYRCTACGEPFEQIKAV